MKLKTALALLSQAELKELGKLLEVGLLGNQASIATCFHACVALMRKDQDWGERDLCLALYPDQDPTVYVKYLRTRTSVLLRHVEQYLAWKVYQSDEVLQEYCLVTALNQRGWEREYRHAYKRAIARIDEAPLRGFAHYAVRVELVEDLMEVETIEQDSSIAEEIQKSLEALDRGFFIKKLSMASKAVSLDHELKLAYRLGMIPSYENWKSSCEVSGEPLVHLFFLLFLITSNPTAASDAYYYQAKSLLLENSTALVASNWSQAYDALKHLLNYCSRRCNQKAESFKNELSALYQRSIKSGILIREKKIDALDFINAFKIFLFADDHQAASWLFRQYGASMHGDSALATRHYCMGYQALMENRFEAASDHFLNALNAPPKAKWPPFEADLIAQLARSKYCQREYSDAEYYAKQLLRRVVDKTHLDAPKNKSFRTFGKYLIALCGLHKGNAGRISLQMAQLKRRYASEQFVFFAKQWIGKQINRE